jgi:membrane protein DedA with SNARE-associated domain
VAASLDSLSSSTLTFGLLMDVLLNLVHDYGYVGIIIFLVLTGCGLPLPEEVALIAAGVLSAPGQPLNPWISLLCCLIGCLVGDSIMYFIGRKIGRRVMNSKTPWGKYLTPEREKLLEYMIHEHGVKVLFVARFLVGIRSPVYLTTGILKFPFVRFILADLLCASVVILLFFGLSYYFGEAVGQWIRNAEYGLTVVVVIGLIIAAIMAWRHYKHNQEPSKPGALEKLLGENEATLKAHEHDPPLDLTAETTSASSEAAAPP